MHWVQHGLVLVWPAAGSPVDGWWCRSRSRARIGSCESDPPSGSSCTIELGAPARECLQTLWICVPHPAWPRRHHPVRSPRMSSTRRLLPPVKRGGREARGARRLGTTLAAGTADSLSGLASTKRCVEPPGFDERRRSHVLARRPRVAAYRASRACAASHSVSIASASAPPPVTASLKARLSCAASGEVARNAGQT